MAVFDYREPITKFLAQATPKNHPSATPMRVNVRVQGEHEFYSGDTVSCIGWLHESFIHKNLYTLYVSNKQNEIKRTRESMSKKVQAMIHNPLLCNLSLEQKNVTKALFFGSRGQGWDALSNTFRRAGMSHILAISGLHIGLYLLLATLVFSKKGAHPLRHTIVVLVVVLLVLCVIELKAPIIRATLVALIVSGTKLLGLRCNTSGLLGIAALMYLLCFPEGATTTSFQLTFIVVTALCVLLPQVQWRILGPQNPNGTIKKATVRLLASLWITGALAWSIASPITARVFGGVAPGGLLSNVPAIFLLATTIVFGIFKTSVNMLCIPVGETATVVFSYSLNALVSLASLVGKAPLAYIYPVSLYWYQSCCIIVWITLWSLLDRKRWIVWTLLPLLACSLLLYKTNQGETIITTIHVGHGTCHVIQHRDTTIMIDSGSRNNLDIGNRTVVPKLRELRVSQIETLIITHADLDHLAGLVDVLQSYTVHKIIVAPQTKANTTEPLELVFSEAKKQKTKIVLGSHGWSEVFENIKLSILSPSKKEKYISSNASSIVLLLQTVGRSILFTGDIDEKRIEALSQKQLPPIDVLELPHHGQWSGESQEFVNTLSPHVIIQSTNRARHAKDKWKIPDNTVRFVTAVDGDITTTISPDGKLHVFASSPPATISQCLFTN